MKSMLARVLAAIAAMLCAAALLPWLTGTPGSDTSSPYARGWNAGLAVILGYPPVYVLLAVTRYFRLRKQPEEDRAVLDQSFANATLIVLAAAAAVQLYAWSLILGWFA